MLELFSTQHSKSCDCTVLLLLLFVFVSIFVVLGPGSSNEVFIKHSYLKIRVNGSMPLIYPITFNL